MKTPLLLGKRFNNLLGGCNGGNVSYAGTGAATLLRIPYVGTILGLSLATVAGIFGISALAGTLRQREAIPELQDEDRIRMQQEGEQQSNPEQFPFVNPQLTPQPTATQQRANMRVQLQRGSTDHYASIELFDITGTGGGVTTNQIIDALRSFAKIQRSLRTERIRKPMMLYEEQLIGHRRVRQTAYLNKDIAGSSTLISRIEAARNVSTSKIW